MPISITTKKLTKMITTCVLNAISTLLLIVDHELTRLVNLWCPTAEQVSRFHTKPTACPLPSSRSRPPSRCVGTPRPGKLRRLSQTTTPTTQGPSVIQQSPWSTRAGGSSLFLKTVNLIVLTPVWSSGGLVHFPFFHTRARSSSFPC